MEEDIKILEENINNIYVMCGFSITNALEHLIKEYKKKDKIIEKMAKYIGEIDVSETLCDNDICHESDNCNECIIEYFKNKVEREVEQ